MVLNVRERNVSGYLSTQLGTREDEVNIVKRLREKYYRIVHHVNKLSTTNTNDLEIKFYIKRII